METNETINKRATSNDLSSVRSSVAGIRLWMQGSPRVLETS